MNSTHNWRSARRHLQPGGGRTFEDVERDLKMDESAIRDVLNVERAETLSSNPSNASGSRRNSRGLGQCQYR